MDITQLRAMVERAIIDGELSRRERDEIMEAIYLDVTRRSSLRSGRHNR